MIKIKYLFAWSFLIYSTYQLKCGIVLSFQFILMPNLGSFYDLISIIKRGEYDMSFERRFLLIKIVFFDEACERNIESGVYYFRHC